MTQNSITRSWVASANDHADFPLQNLPLGVFSLKDSAPRAGVACFRVLRKCIYIYYLRTRVCERSL